MRAHWDVAELRGRGPNREQLEFTSAQADGIRGRLTTSRP
jgi:hypothetical protein